MSLAKSLENTLLTIGNTTVSKEPEESVEEAPEESEELVEPVEESNKLIFIDEKGSTIEQSSNIFNSIYYSVKDILIIYGVSFILYNIYIYLSN
jgi:hypothetical protein